MKPRLAVYTALMLQIACACAWTAETLPDPQKDFTQCGCVPSALMSCSTAPGSSRTDAKPKHGHVVYNVVEVLGVWMSHGALHSLLQRPANETDNAVAVRATNTPSIPCIND